ncbi:hypothetical protein BOX15_Mlig019538g2 [Macrostomum lignano]|uniref:Uncharacterized protein n=2 Tax=Macrostomum lignano TaxID=282301 RepID=A0A267G623_9PLAT|nr:hypothetical protein BOX15_Mlig019538g1 [Macrostomum lignano]PAA80834.1 hypothetical protein BOX15_Mlig019538g2 [Macrostomum lignano]
MQSCSVMLLVILLCQGLGIFAKDIKVDFVDKPATISYNFFSGSYEVMLAFKIAAVGPQNDQPTVTGLDVKVDKGKDFGVGVTARVSRGGTAGELIFECGNQDRCNSIKKFIDLDNSVVHKTVQFVPVGLHFGRFESLRADNSASRPALGEVVFQQHSGNSISFLQNWEVYAEGFGFPHEDYWMGLKRLSSLTKDRSCKLIFQATKFDGTVQKGTYKDFQVRGEDENFKLRVGDAESGDLTGDMKLHDNMEFSTFDRDNDKSNESCSETHGRAGWWFNACGSHSPNGIIVAEKDLGKADCREYCSSRSKKEDKRICWKATKLSFTCV